VLLQRAGAPEVRRFRDDRPTTERDDRERVR
jgi:hypothetical protein